MLAPTHQTTWHHDKHFTNAGTYPPNYMASRQTLYKCWHLSTKLHGITTDTLQMLAPTHQTTWHHDRHFTNAGTYPPNYMASRQTPYKCWHLPTKLHGIMTDTLQMLAPTHQTTWHHDRHLTYAGTYPPNYMA